jgi:protein-glutamine gamma-glutamyltransferase
MTAWKRVLATLPHVIRAVAFSLAAFSLALGLTSNAGLASAMLGATLGVVVGQRLAASRFKLTFILAAIGAIFLLTWGFAKVCVAWEIVPRIIGPAPTLSLVEVLRFAILPAAVCAMLRSAAARRPTLVGLELLFVAAAVTSVFAAHREGVISRPLWLADWAFRNDVDPARVILGTGFVAAFLLATLLLVETRSKRAVSSLAVIVALAAIGMLCISAVGLPKPQPQTEAGRTDEQGEEPPPPPPGDGGGGNPDNKDDGGGATPPPDKGDGGGSSPPDGGAGEGGSPPPNQPPPSERLTDDPGNGASPQPVAVVLLADDYSPPSQSYFFRQEALSQWNGTRLVATGRGDADHDGVSSFPTEKTLVRDPPPAKGRTLVRHTVALLTEHANPFGLEAPISFSPAPNPNPSRFIRAYKVESLAQEVDYQRLIGRKAGDPTWSPDLRSYYTLGPSDPRYGELAKRYVRDLPPKIKDDPFAMALAVKTHLDHDLTYSTKIKYASAGDPTALFLFGKKIGYCVHFAHAAALLWRSLGIPARVVAGYRADEDARKGGSALVIKGGDAHMWPELYLEGVGWMVLDITAEKNLDPPSTPQDEDLQRLLGNMARNDAPDPEQPGPPVQHHYGRDASLVGGSLLLLAALVLYLAKIWRRLAPTVASARSLPRVGYRAALDMLAEVGLARTFGETREAFAERAAAAAPSFREITKMHVAARLRDPSTPLAARTELARTYWMPALARLRSDLATHTKAGKRFLGILNPTSFFASR